MRKVLFSVLVCAMAGIMASCSSNSPRGVAEKALGCVVKGDIEGYVDCSYLSEDDEEFKESVVGMIRSNMERLRPSQQIESFEFVEDDIDEKDGRAKVVFNVTYKSGDTRKEPISLVQKDGKWLIEFGR